MNTLTSSWLFSIGLLSTILLGIALTLSMSLRRSSAARVHGVLLGATLALPVLAAVSLIPEESRLQWIPERSSIEAIGEALSAPLSEVYPTANHHTHSAAPIRSSPSSNWSPQVLLVSVCLFGIAGSFILHGVGFLRLRTLRRSLTPADERLQHSLRSIAETANLTITPRLLISHQDSVPMTWGWGRNHIVALPLTAKSWSDERLRRVLLHEVAHVARRDCWWSSISTICLSLVWYHPLAWLMRRRLAETRERAADDWALNECVDPHAYAEDLIAVVTQCRRPVRLTCGIAMADTTGLKRRLSAMIDQRIDRRPFQKWQARGAIALWAVFAACLGLLAACKQPAPTAVTLATAASPLTKSQLAAARTSLEVTMQMHVFSDNDPNFIREIYPEAIPEGTLSMRSLSLEDGNQVLEALSRKRSAKLLYAPTLSTYSGSAAKFEKLRELIYPTEYDPPQMPDEPSPSFAVTPASPKSFETRNLGFTFETKPTVTMSGTIAAEMTIENTHLCGFVNYGSPIHGAAKNNFGKPISVVITENRILMPVFSTVRSTISINASNGQYVMLVGSHGKHVEEHDWTKESQQPLTDDDLRVEEPEAKDHLIILLHLAAEAK